MEKHCGVCKQILRKRPYGRTDKEGGKRRSAEVIADNVYFGDSKPKEDGAPSADADFGAPPSGFTPDFGDDGEMPF